MQYTKETFKLIPNNVGGIYKILNLDGGKYYIGRSKRIRHRWYVHVRQLSMNTHTNPYLQKAWNKSSNFVFEILEECSSEHLKEREYYWIDKLDAYNPEKAYNLFDDRKAKQWMWDIKPTEPKKPEDLILVDKHDIATRKKISWDEYKELSGKAYFPPKNSFSKWFVFREHDDIDEMLPDLIKRAIQGNYYSRTAKGKNERKLWVWNKETKEFITVYDSIGEAGRQLDINPKRIQANINKKAVGDYIFTDKNEKPTWHTTKTGPKPKSVVIDGVEYKTVREAANAIGISEDGIRHRLRRKTKPEPEPGPKWLLKKDDVEIKLSKATDAINHVPNATIRGIKKLREGRYNSYYGWTLEKI